MSGLGGAWQDVVCVIALIVSLPSRVTFSVVTSLDPGNHARQAPLRSLRRRTSPFVPVVREMVFPPATGANEIRACGNGLSCIRQVAWAGAPMLNASEMPNHQVLYDDMRRFTLNWSKSCRDRRLSDRLDVQRQTIHRPRASLPSASLSPKSPFSALPALPRYFIPDM